MKAYLFLHAILMVAIGEVETHSIREVEVDLVHESVAFPELAENFFLLVLRWK